MVTCIWHVLAWNLHEEMLKNIVQTIRSKHFGIFHICGSDFASPSGRMHFRKVHPHKQSVNKGRLGFYKTVRPHPALIDFCGFKKTSHSTLN